MDLTTQKLELIEWLIQLKDKSVIDYLNTIKDSISSDTDWWDELTDDQKASIERGMKDIEEGRFHTHESVKKKYERYL
jgi:predicted transcriptional regulator